MGKKILVVDDSSTIRQQINFVLSQGGFEVVEAQDGKDGLAKLKGNPGISMVISDVNMPVMGGLEMVELMRKDPANANLPVIILTTEGTAALIERGKAAGAKGWLVKPFRPEQLLTVAKKLAA